MTENKLIIVLKSRELWVSLLGFLILGIRYVYPEFKLNVEEMSGLIILTVSYIFALSQEGDNKEQWIGLMKSRKFWSFVVGISVLFINGFGKLLPLQLSSEQLIGFLSIIAGYITTIAFEKNKEVPKG